MTPKKVGSVKRKGVSVQRNRRGPFGFGYVCAEKCHFALGRVEAKLMSRGIVCAYRWMPLPGS